MDQFELYRTAYASHYGSGKHFVNDLIHFHVKIPAESEGNSLSVISL